MGIKKPGRGRVGWKGNLEACQNLMDTLSPLRPSRLIES